LQNPKSDSAQTSYRLLTDADPAPVIVSNAGAATRLLLIGDHAGREIPRELATLGLTDGELDRHIAWDIGVEGLGAKMAAALGACFIRQRYSRLVIDCNRAPGSEDSIPLVSDAVAIPGNLRLTEQERLARRNEIYQPYQDRIAAELDARASVAGGTVLVALHSFTPSLQGVARPWSFGILHQGDSPFSARMLAVMSLALGAVVGDNQPYAMDQSDHSVALHMTGRSLDYLELEVRQDLIADEAGQLAICVKLATFFAAASEMEAHRRSPKI
jgi:predicted N-formylglutamate amidohydrolase